MDKAQVNELAELLSVTTRTIYSYIDRGAPCGDLDKLSVWVLAQPRSAASAKAWARSHIEAAAAAKMKRKPRKKLSEETDELEILKAVLREHTAALDEATESNNLTDVKFYTDSVKSLASTIRETEAHAKRMGLRTGETIERKEIERILRAMFNAGNTCIHQKLTQYCQQWADIHEPADLYFDMKPRLVFDALFSGFAKYEMAKGEPHIPQWVVDIARKEAKQYICSEYIDAAFDGDDE